MIIIKNIYIFISLNYHFYYIFFFSKQVKSVGQKKSCGARAAVCSHNLCQHPTYDSVELESNCTMHGRFTGTPPHHVSTEFHTIIPLFLSSFEDEQLFQ